jgi:hypothetical protein
MSYRVIAPLVYLRVPDAGGKLVSLTFYQGAPVPEDVDEASLQHHLDSGLVAEDKDALADVLGVPAGTPIPGEPPNRPVTEQDGGPVDFGERAESAKKAAAEAKPKPSSKSS